MLKTIISLTLIPFLGLFFVGELDFVSRTGNIFGYIGLMMMLWSIILGAKPISRFISQDYAKLNIIHRFLGKYGAIFVLIHPIIQMFSYIESVLWILLPSLESELELHITYGRFALYIFLIIWLSSWLLRGLLKYRPWLLIHYLTYPLVLLALLHLRDIGYYWQTLPAINVLMNVILVLYVLFLVYMFLLLAGFFKKEYSLAKINIIGKGSKVALLSLSLLSKKPMSSSPGQYVYLQLDGFKEARPFSILSNSGKELTLGIKLEGSFTKKVHSLQPGKKVFVYGPLGEFTSPGHNQEDKIIIAGGIGITPLVDLAAKYFTPNSTFIVCNRYQEDVADLQRLKQLIPDANLYELYSQEPHDTSAHHRACRLDQSVMTEILSGKNLANQKVFLCGSPKFMDATAANLKALGMPANNIFTENFSF